MYHRFISFIKSLQSHRLSSVKDPEELIQRTIKDMNEKIPGMSRNIAMLKEETAHLKKECVRLSKEQYGLVEKRKLAIKTDQNGYAANIEEMISACKSSLSSAGSQLEDVRIAYKDALDSMKNYIRRNRRKIRSAISKVKDHERIEWEEKCENIMKQFEALENLDRGFANGNSGLRKISKSETKSKSPEHDSDEFLQERIHKGYDKVKGLHLLSGSITKNDVKMNVDEIVHLSEQILDDIITNPRDIKKARMFLSYYLDAIIKVIKGYVRLSSQDAESEEILTSLKKSETIIKTIRDAFKKLLARMMEYDILDLDTEIEVLKKALKVDELR